jgi:7 transmembrane receptor (Secretin family)
MFGGLNTVACVFVTTGYHYFLLTNFFWMMVEGEHADKKTLSQPRHEKKI